MRTVWGIPNCVVRLSTEHFTNAGARWVPTPRVQHRPSHSGLNRNIVFLAILCRVHLLRVRHAERPCPSNAMGGSQNSGIIPTLRLPLTILRAPTSLVGS